MKILFSIELKFYIAQKFTATSLVCVIVAGVLAASVIVQTLRFLRVNVIVVPLLR